VIILVLALWHGVIVIHTLIHVHFATCLAAGVHLATASVLTRLLQLLQPNAVVRRISIMERAHSTILAQDLLLTPRQKHPAVHALVQLHLTACLAALRDIHGAHPKA
jgi:hypothetical protein